MSWTKSVFTLIIQGYTYRKRKKAERRKKIYVLDHHCCLRTKNSFRWPSASLYPKPGEEKPDKFLGRFVNTKYIVTAKEEVGTRWSRGDIIQFESPLLLSSPLRGLPNEQTFPRPPGSSLLLDLGLVSSFVHIWVHYTEELFEIKTFVKFNFFNGKVKL